MNMTAAVFSLCSTNNAVYAYLDNFTYIGVTIGPSAVNFNENWRKEKENTPRPIPAITIIASLCEKKLVLILHIFLIFNLTWVFFSKILRQSNLTLNYFIKYFKFATGSFSSTGGISFKFSTINRNILKICPMWKNIVYPID